MKDHFLDNWANLKSVTQIAELFDNYEDVRKVNLKPMDRHSSVYHPQSNPVERFHRTLKRLLRVLCLDAGSEWDKHFPSILLASRTVSHESTGYTPSELVYGKNLQTPERR
ncbi:retrovirus-related Pol polyprotein from transposon 412 [Trichonephila clavipes]|nr:retrovirus-related Pol polyprotein from transposon 412 [Trichonephila clavipes]